METCSEHAMVYTHMDDGHAGAQADFVFRVKAVKPPAATHHTQTGGVVPRRPPAPRRRWEGPRPAGRRDAVSTRASAAQAPLLISESFVAIANSCT